jgi:hypothetical protein
LAKGQHLSGYQQKIVKRYYQNLDTIALTRLAELVSDLAVATDAKAAEKLWKRASEALKRGGVEAAEVDSIVTAKDTKRLATLVGEMWNSAGSTSAKPAAKRDSRYM